MSTSIPITKLVSNNLRRVQWVALFAISSLGFVGFWLYAGESSGSAQAEASAIVEQYAPNLESIFVLEESDALEVALERMSLQRSWLSYSDQPYSESLVKVSMEFPVGPASQPFGRIYGQIDLLAAMDWEIVGLVLAFLVSIWFFVRLIFRRVLTELQSSVSSPLKAFSDGLELSESFKAPQSLGKEHSKVREIEILRKSILELFGRIESDAKQLERAKTSEAIARTTQLLAHDVRKPFSILKLLLDSLRMPMPEDEKAEFLKEGMQEVDSAIASVNGFLEDLMTVGAADPKLNRDDVSVRSMVEECLREQARVHPKANIKVKMDYSGVDLVCVDRAKILRVFSNIVINAIQAMKQNGRIEFRTVNDGSMTQVSISNFGSHIPHHSLAHLFDTFFTSGKQGGTGLGLAIAKKWVEAHGGAISCSSEEGSVPEASWVRFDFTLAHSRKAHVSEPASRECTLSEFVPEVLKTSSSSGGQSSDLIDYEEALKLARASAKRLGKLKVLLLEDEKPYADGLRRLYSQIFEAEKSFVWASTPEDFASQMAHLEPDLVILDIDLKGAGSDGLDVLRNHAMSLKQATVCVHSNRADSQTVSESLGAGAQFVFPKPMTLSHFTKLVDYVADQNGTKEVQNEGAQPLKVAVVEDVLVFRRAWREKLRHDCTVELFKSSSDFLKDTSKADFDVVITDFHLGDGEPTGAELAKELRESGFSGPIVLASGLDDVSGELAHLFSAFATKTELITPAELRALTR